MTTENGRRPDALTLAGFTTVSLLGGANLVAVRFSNQGLPPFYGAATRFLAASILLLGYMVVRRIPAPSRDEWKGTLIYGVLGFAGFYAFGYWALVSLSSGVAGVIAASVPLITLLLAVVHKLEPFTTRGAIGAAMTIAGIAVMVGIPSEVSLPLAPLLAMLAAAICDAEVGIAIKKLPTGHPVATNAMAMLTGSVLLFLISAAWREPWSLPTDPTTLTALIYLVIGGSIGLFMLYLFTLKRWTASGMSYMFVVMPVVASLLGILLLDERISPTVAIGGLIIVAGVYVGALSGRAAEGREAPAELAGLEVANPSLTEKND
jgi:drug/metabolite transporter (DMT)-like permease